MTWPRVDGLRALELGTPGELRARLNGLVLAGRKRATAGLLGEYDEEGEALEHPGERLALLDDAGARIATVEVTSVETVRFADVPWEFAAAEGEGDRDLEEWRAGHRRFWAAEGTAVTDDTEVVLVRFELA
ncbi:ASCH domain-containing protein [Nocardioides sp. TF02-7]|uniref:ASCH domain-containing protein n=1 Tax=Nocardioides sp. TF02-7 TaxID=2917724 RepID=UPI001F05E7F9|nr:ASCH domain-containing protein [Nocardioides sp. TF02-7]UMG91399.1 ASCH domain-containing protein [Nocardioides sp. TF02-7]